MKPAGLETVFGVEGKRCRRVTSTAAQAQDWIGGQGGLIWS
jgi:hypothetical protein